MNDDRRVMVIDGCRTPFARSGTAFAGLSAFDLGCAAVAGLMHRTALTPAAVDLLVLGTVLQEPSTSNLAREVVLGAGLPAGCPAHTVTMACISSLQAVLDGVRAIRCGDADIVIAGGAETFSDVPIRFRRPVRQRLLAARKKGLAGRLRLLRGLRPRDLLPEAPALAEFSTGESMGEAAERLAKRLGIGRGEQDEFALESHRRAARAHADGLLSRQIVPLFVPPTMRRIATDNGVRPEASLAALGALGPAFDRRFGTVTAGNSSFLTDGGAAVLLAAEDAAERLGLVPKAAIRAIATTASDPLEELLVGPALAIPAALKRAGATLPEVPVIELHEAFAAQVLAISRLLADEVFCRDRLGAEAPIGPLDPERLNRWGGSLSVGHPFGATGARLVMTCCDRLRDEGGALGLVAACAAGGLSHAMVLEAA